MDRSTSPELMQFIDNTRQNAFNSSGGRYWDWNDMKKVIELAGAIESKLFNN